MSATESVVEIPTHAPFSPSGFNRKVLCPGSHNAEKPYTSKSGQAAIDGTHTHTLVETCIIHNKKDATPYIGSKLIDHEGEFEVKADRVERANMALSYVNNLVTTSSQHVFVEPEARLDPGSLIFRNDWYGSGDITMVAVTDYVEGDSVNSANIEWINVIDYKDGGQPVDPFENYQGISYMLGAIALVNPPFTTPIRFTIIQPKAGGIKEWDTTVGELMTKWLPHCQSIIEACLATDAPRVAGEQQCMYCMDKKQCRARHEKAVDGINDAMGGIQIRGMSADIAVTDEIDFSGDKAPTVSTTLPVIGDMDNETISKVISLAPLIRGWLKDLDEEALRRVKEGGRIPGYKLIQKRGRRSWELDDESKIIKALLTMTANKARIFKRADIVEEKLTSFTKILANQNLTSTQKQRIENDFLKHPEGQRTLVLETEKGEDISPASLLTNADLPVITMVDNSNSEA